MSLINIFLITVGVMAYFFIAYMVLYFFTAYEKLSRTKIVWAAFKALFFPLSLIFYLFKKSFKNIGTNTFVGF